MKHSCAFLLLGHVCQPSVPREGEGGMSGADTLRTPSCPFDKLDSPGSRLHDPLSLRCLARSLCQRQAWGTEGARPLSDLHPVPEKGADSPGPALRRVTFTACAEVQVPLKKDMNPLDVGVQADGRKTQQPVARPRSRLSEETGLVGVGRGRAAYPQTAPQNK